MGSKDDTLQLSIQERMAGLAKAKSSAERLKAGGVSLSRLGQDQSVSLDDVRATVETWPAAPKNVAEKLLHHYGAPNEATPTKLFWYSTGPWSRMELTADEVVHNFPTPHTDFLTQYVHYPVDRSASANWSASTAACWWTGPRARSGRVATTRRSTS